jgi:hypothetical protein
VGFRRISKSEFHALEFQDALGKSAIDCMESGRLNGIYLERPTVLGFGAAFQARMEELTTGSAHRDGEL